MRHEPPINEPSKLTQIHFHGCGGHIQGCKYQCCFKSAKYGNCGKHGHIATVYQVLKNTDIPNQDTKSKELILVDEAIRDMEKVGIKMFASPRLNISSRLMAKQAMITLWEKKQWV